MDFCDIISAEQSHRGNLMNNNDDNLDLLDLNDDTDTLDDSLPDAAPFTNPRPRRPWLLLALGAVIIILAIYIIFRTISDDSSSSMQVDLDAPAIVIEGEGGMPVDVNPEPAPTTVAPQPAAQPQPAPAPQPVAQPQPQNTTPGVPVRVIEDRQEVKFNPDAVQAAPAPKPVAQLQPAPKPAAQPKQQPRRAAQTAQNAPRNSGWYVQFGSYSTRALAVSGQRPLQNGPRNLLSNQQFVILAAVLPNGSTTYRLRIAFDSSANANAFCRNAKSDGVDCYVTK